jgi:catechol 2,3-dioxygenase-like lactoylglutathione lyase family enzyme
VNDNPTYHHVGVLVPDMDEAIRWFADVLGVTIHPPHRMITEGRIDPGEFGDDEPHEGTSHLAWSADGPPYYELVEAKDASHGRGMHSLEKQGAGLHHVGRYVPDVDAEIERLRALGVGLQGRILGRDGRTMACWTERSPQTGLAVEYLDERLLAPTQAWIETGERPQVPGAIR